MQGIELCRNLWQPLLDGPDGQNALRPIYLLGAEDVTSEEELLTEIPPQREELSKQIPGQCGTNRLLLVTLSRGYC